MQPRWASELYATLEQRAKQIDTVYGLVAQTLKERTTDEWLTLFRELEIPAAPINTPDALFDDPHLNAVGLFETVETPHGPVRFPGVPTWFSRTPGRVAGPAPELGADTAAVLDELGLDVARHRTRTGIGIGATVDFEMGENGRRAAPRTARFGASSMCPPTIWARSPTTRRPGDGPAVLPTLAERGLLCMAWPEEYGGGGASVWEQTVVREEMWAHHEPRGAQYMGVNWVGPTIMRHGTAEQQRKHLPPIAARRGDLVPGLLRTGRRSDLASLRTTARRDGDGWRVNGQKIWTSYATMAQWCFLLARTSGEGAAKKQQGLTIFLVPMDDPAIEVRPIRCMLGPHHLNEVFFDDLRVTEADCSAPSTTAGRSCRT